MNMASLSQAVAEVQAPAFASADACRKWLARLPLANAVQTQAEILAQINLLNRHAAAPLERLKILDTLRGPIIFAGTETSRRFAGHPLPFTPSEQAAFDTNRVLGQAATSGYLLCIDACLAGERGIADAAATACERAMATLAGEQFEYYRAGREIPRDFWRRLHRAFAAAERLAVSESDVPDRHVDKRQTSARAFYAFILMLHAASPYELSARQLTVVRRWLSRWSSRIPVLAAPPADFKLPPLAVDLSGEAPAMQKPAAIGNLRYLDPTPLARKIKRRVTGLQQGATPESLGLGDDCKQPGCEQLLRHLYERCCKGGIARTDTRRPASGQCRFILGAEAAHYYLSGRKPFEPPVRGAELTKQQFDALATFGRITMPKEDNYSLQHGYRIETWRIVDESKGGMRLSRLPGADGNRVSRGCLAAVAVTGTGFLLASLRWVMQSEEQAIHAGIQLIAGAPRMIAVFPGDAPHGKESWRPGFLCPEVADLNIPATLILPAGWHRLGRIIEIFDHGHGKVRLARVVERGIDFERSEYEPL